ncbi:leucine-rich repeat transmembrane protein FLRT3-like [Phyllobates terribilis]|uniref:leucine-rich repeat transmembrane protein FLRT3-like n=1 Tax=Phyllobates terribilis TaxID=111132 RepID=UPI003CCB4B81
MDWSVLMLLGLLANTWVSAEQFAPCPEKCTCLTAEHHVKCTSGNLTAVPPEIANSTIELHMDHNNLTFLRQSFHQDLPEMRFLYFRNCNIKTIKPGAFQKVTGLEHLYLDTNEIQELENGTFEDLSNLFYLYLQKNKISHLQPDIFSPLKNLLALYLTDNLLTEISDGSLKGLTQLRWLDLGFNMISNISNEAFKASVYLRKLDLQYNLLTSVPAFKSIIILKVLRLSGNRIRRLSSTSFNRNSKSVSELYIDNMGLKSVSRLVFSRLRRLDVLDVRNNSLTSLSVSKLKSSTTIYLTGNPWKCDCSIAELYVRLLMGNKNDPEQEVLCKSPKGLEGRSLTTINILNLKCKSFAVDATTFLPANQTEGKFINTSPSVVTSNKEVTKTTSTPTFTTWINIIEEDPCFADDISNILVKPAGEDSLDVSWSSFRDYRYFQIEYSSVDHRDTLHISGKQTQAQLFHLLPGTTYSVCIIPQIKDITTCETPKLKQCASGETSARSETAYHSHSLPKATTSPFVIIGSTVAGLVILVAAIITGYALRSSNFQFQRYHNEEETEGGKEDDTDPYKWGGEYENIDEDRHVYVTSSSLWGMDNEKLDCSLAESISLPSVPKYVSL